MTSLKTSIKTITYLSDIGCLEIQGASLTCDNFIKTFYKAHFNADNIYIPQYKLYIVLLSAIIKIISVLLMPFWLQQQ